MNSEVSTRFVNCHEVLKSRGMVKSSRQFALSLDYAPQSFSDIVNGKRDVTIELVRKAVKQYHFSAQYLFTGEGEMFIDDLKLPDPILTVCVDQEGEERIVHVPVSAQAGYIDQLYDQEFIGNLPSFTLPGDRFRRGTFRCFDVKGDSMEPTLFSGDRIVCSFVDRDYWNSSIRDNHVYVVIAKSGVIVKRVINNISIDQCLKCISDNSYYESFELPLEAIKELWKVEVKISTFMHSPGNVRNAFHEEIDHLKAVIENQSVQIKSFNKSMELLLKNKRVG